MTKRGSEARREQEKLKADLERQLEAGVAERDKKLAASKEYLHAMLEGVSKKYRTVNGYMMAMDTLNQISYGDFQIATGEGMGDVAMRVAARMSSTAAGLAEQLVDVDVSTLDETFLAGLLDEDFIATAHPVDVVAEQLLIVQLLQNAGLAIDDIVAFREGTTEGIAKLEEELAKLDKPKNGGLTAIDGGQEA